MPSEGFGVLDADVVIWQGDLNYRLGDEGDAPPPPSPSFARRASVVAGAVVGGAAAVATGVGVAVVGVGAAVAGGAAVGAGATAGAEKLVTPTTPTTPKEDIWRDVVDAIEKEDWATLRSRDQLLDAMDTGVAFDGFREAKLAFPPTYKLIRNDEDALRYKQNRRPAWCDRVIWRGDAVSCKAYDCVPSALSDPVWKSKFYGAIDATPVRWRGDAGSSPLDQARTAASSPRNDLVKNSRVHLTHWLIPTQVVACRPEDKRDAVVAFRSSQLRVESRQGRYLRESSLCHQHAVAATIVTAREGNKSHAAITHRRAEDPGVLRIRPRAQPQAPLFDGVRRRRRGDESFQVHVLDIEAAGPLPSK